MTALLDSTLHSVNDIRHLQVIYDMDSVYNNGGMAGREIDTMMRTVDMGVFCWNCHIWQRYRVGQRYAQYICGGPTYLKARVTSSYVKVF